MTELHSHAGEVVASRYALEALLGVGGMGAVYRAYDRELDEHVALKLLHADRARAADALDFFKGEVKLARRVTHKNVARMFELGVHHGLRFLTMELVEGESLKKLLTRRGKLTVEEAVHIAANVAAGLEAAHAAGVVHRDIKPDNILIEKSGRVVITDFGVALGVAKPIRQDPSTASTFAGTPTYMAPEQIDNGDITPKADLFALGVVLYETLCGKPPWHRDNPLATLSARIPNAELTAKDFDPSLPPPVVDLILDCTQNDPLKRPANAQEVQRRLDPAAISEDTFEIEEPKKTSSTPSLAVLPLRSRDNNELAQFFTEDLIDALCTVPGVRVMSLSSVRALKIEGTTAQDRGQALGATMVLDGSLRTKQEQTQISVRLIRVADGAQVWAELFEVEPSKVLGLADTIAQAIARALDLEPVVTSRELPADPALLDLYLRARRAYHLLNSESMETAAKLFERALLAAPNNAVITAGLAMTRIRAWFLASNPDPSVAITALETAERAVAYGPHLGEPHLALGMAHLHSGEPARAARELRLAIARSPSLPEAHDYLGRLLAEAGRVADGLGRMRVAIELDRELSPIYWEIARTRALLSEWKEAMTLAEDLSRTHHARPGLLARILTWRNDERGLRELDRQLKRDSFDQTTQLAVATIDLWLGRIKPEAHYKLFEANMPGRAGSSRRLGLLLQIKTEHAAKMGDADVAIDALERADACGLIDLVWMMRCPLLESIRKRPEFLRVQEHVNRRADAVCEAVWG